MCPQSREIPPMYSDGIDAPRRFGVSGEELPSARAISNELHKTDGQSPRNDKLTMMVMQWGQFIDHDIVSTPLMKDPIGANIECCGEGNENRTECFPIRIPDDDPFYNRTCMGMVRSAPVLDHNCEPGFLKIYEDIETISEQLPPDTNDRCIIEAPKDHCALADITHWRVHCNLGQANMAYDGSFILPDHTEEQRLKIQNVYSHVDDIDLFAGAMTKTLLPDSSVGPTFACLLGKQFKKLREGDRYWHETQDPIIKFSKDQLTELRKVSFARVLCDNFDVSQVQPDVFHVPGTGNERVDCGQIQGINLEKWTSCDFLPDGRPNLNSSCRKKRNQE
ncbi:thyroid peroxidase-like [Ruditapes philippinarum]|uniref:thyroid peroxidase-like n=1 Tax=Ruditapes philippinarum TaxID=129788 RepID=UPI00295AD7F7|nr:thyroid peroxidase-like [Ruditapes philippinarum]